MDYYLDISFLAQPDPEFSPHMLMNVLFNKLHPALVQLKTTSIGVSFPGYNEKKHSLGEKIRLHGSRQSIDSLIKLEWLKGLQDYCAVGNPEPVPENVKFMNVRRVQVKSNIDRLIRRYAKRHQVTYEEAKKLYSEAQRKESNLPFIQLKSTSTGQNFRLLIKQEEAQEAVSNQPFNTYGISCTATLPKF